MGERRKCDGCGGMTTTKKSNILMCNGHDLRLPLQQNEHNVVIANVLIVINSFDFCLAKMSKNVSQNIVGVLVAI